MIPIYRAQLIDSDEYVIGHLTTELHPGHTKYFIVPLQTTINEWSHHYRINPTTLSIHLPGMISSMDEQLFASLSDCGTGGDMVYIAGKGNCYLTHSLNGVEAVIIDNTANITDDIFPLSESLFEDDVESIIGVYNE